MRSAFRVVAAGRARPYRAACQRSLSAVPQIDLGPFLKGTPEGKAKVARELDSAGADIGFLTVTNHGVPSNVIDDMNRVTRAYFDLPVAAKRKVAMTDDYPYGYTGFLEEKLAKGHGVQSAKPDLKECFAIGPYNPDAGMPPIRWPQQPAEMAAVWTAYYKAMENLASQILRAMALGLGMPETFFEDKTTKHRSALRALNYPESATAPEAGQQRAGAHTDYGSITILLQDAVGGLQVLTKDQEWQDVPYIPGSYVINLGDLMARWTNDRYVSTLHRVVPRQPRRQSIAFFQNINADHVVTCIETCQSPSNPPKYAPIKAWDHLMQKHSASVKY